jgi:hypothetical protein
MDGGAPGYDGSAAYVLAAGLSAAHLGDMETAGRALTIMQGMRAQAESGSNAYRAKPFVIMEKEISGLIHFVRNGPNDREHAEQLLKDAVELEKTLDAPSGPTEPIKPSFEMLGEFLLAQGRLKDASVAFEQSLLRTPNRRAAVQGLAKAAPAKSTTQAGAR